MNRNELIETKMQEHWDYLQSAGYEVAALFLQGSQNYGTDIYTDEYQSDVDTKAIILPTLDNIVNGDMPLSLTHVMPDNSHIDIKDIRIMIDMWEKQNISYLELLYTQYRIINAQYCQFIERLLQMRDNITAMHKNQLLRCIQGMSGNKVKALEHPYPNLIEKIEKYGYDEKQLLHIVRLNDFITQWMSNEIDCDSTFAKFYKPYPETLEFITRIRNHYYSLEDAREISDKYDNDTTNRIKQYISEHTPDTIIESVKNDMNDIKVAMIRFALKKELINNVDVK